MKLVLNIKDKQDKLQLLLATLFIFVVGALGLKLTLFSHAAAPTVPFGTYNDANSVSEVSSFNSQTAVKPSIVEVYGDGNNDNMNDYTNANLSYTGVGGSGTRLLLGMNVCANNGGTQSDGTLAYGAAGGYNSGWKQLGSNLVAEGFSNAIIRIGVEIYGNWENCYVNSPTSAANFATYYQNIVNSMRSVSGQQFLFDWECMPYGGNTSFTASQCWPGASYVNYVGDDTYDETWNSSCGYQYSASATATQSQCAWTSTVLPNLTMALNWAKQYGVKVALPEWGLAVRSDNAGLGDDPTFINNISSWLTTNASYTGFDIYFDSDSGGQYDMITDGKFPNALSAFESDFAGSNSTVGSSTSSPPPATPTVTAPSGVTASATSDTSAKLSWTASTDTGSQLAGYTVLRSTSGGSYTNINSVSPTTTSYTDSSLSPSTAYSYKVEAYDNSSPAITATSSSGSVTTPAAPVTTNYVTVPFYMQAGASAGYSDSVTGTNWQKDQYYTVDANFGVTGGASTGGDGSSCSTSLEDTNCTTHAIASTDDPQPYQKERWGNFHYDIPIANGSYTVILKFAEINPNSGTRTFNVTIEGNQVLSNYNIAAAVGNYTSDDQSFQANVTNNDLNITYVSVSNTAKIAAIEVLPAAVAVPSPSAPTGLNAIVKTDTSATFTWSQASDTGGPGIADYYLVCNGSTVQTVVANGATSFSYTDSSLSPSTAYSCYVYDRDNAGNYSSNSSSVTFTTPAAPATATIPTTPSGLSAMAVSSSQINLSWTASTATSTSVQGYYVYQAEETNGSCGSYSKISAVTTTSLGITGLSPSTSYCFYVVAYDSVGNSSNSATAVTTTQASSTATTIEVYGNVTNSSNGSPIGGVYIYTSANATSSGATSTYTNSSGQYILASLIPGSSHSYSFIDKGYRNRTYYEIYNASTNLLNVSLRPHYGG